MLSILKHGCILIAATLCSAVYAQNISVWGNITDSSDGAGIPYASIHLEGTMTGTSSDEHGHYSISVPHDGMLVFSSIGYKTKEVRIASDGEINVELTPDSQFIDETIVVAYGTATRSSFTGSASVINSESIESRATTNITSALAGAAPGVQVISSSGDPAADGPAIRIRGIGSMSASNAPLYIVDGMPYDGHISDINPNDVESMSVLKDAAASAIYGARGANGVILITTKRARGQDALIRFDAKWGSNSRLIPQYDVITDPAEYYQIHYRMMYNSQIYSGRSPQEAYAYADATLFDQNNGGLGYKVFTIPEGEKFIGEDFRLNPKARLGYSDGEYYYIPDNWYKEAFHNSFRQEYNLSISGAQNRLSYYCRLGMLDDGGIVNNSGFKRYTARINSDYQAKSWLKMTTNFSYTHTDSQTASYSDGYGSSSNIFYVTNNIGPIYPLYVRDAEGRIIYENGMKVYDANQTNFTRPSIVGNAVRDNEVNRKRNYSDMAAGKIGLTIIPFEGFSLTGNIGLTNGNRRYNALYSEFGSSSSTDGLAYVSHERDFAVNFQLLGTYKTDLGGTGHKLEALAGYELYRLKIQQLEGQNERLYDPLVGELGNADGSKGKKTSSFTAGYLTQGVLARIQYDYAEKYYIGASYRRDGSSRFAKGHRWGDFGSISGAWLMSREIFMQSISWIDMLKLKISWGVQGNDNLYPTASYARKYYPYSDNYTHSYNEQTGEYSLTLAYKGNEELTWESSHAFNVGMDFELWSGYLNGSVEYFSRRTTDLLYSKDVPLSSGNPTGQYPVNIGSILNRGFEASLYGNIFNTRKVQWTWNANISHYRNRILSLDPSIAEEGIKGSNYIYKIGGSLYEAYMYRYAGVDKKSGKGLYYKTENVQTVTTEVFADAGQFECGSVLPKVYGGLGTALNIYGVDFSVQMSFQLGGRYYDGTYQALMHTDSATGCAWHKDVLKSWSEDNPTSDIPRLDGDTSVGQSPVDRFLISSNYLSINNMTLGYTFPDKWMDEIRVSSIRIYFTADNLAVISARKGVDPRYSIGLGSLTSGSGLNSGAYSSMRTLTGGVSITF